MRSTSRTTARRSERLALRNRQAITAIVTQNGKGYDAGKGGIFVNLLLHKRIQLASSFRPLYRLRLSQCPRERGTVLRQ
jgi:hypothetical protein